jgi:hypothetical protein
VARSNRWLSFHYSNRSHLYVCYVAADDLVHGLRSCSCGRLRNGGRIIRLIQRR